MDPQIRPEHRAVMNELARFLDDTINPGHELPGVKRKYGFALLVFDFTDEKTGETGHMNYISNARREDMLIAMKEFISKWEAPQSKPGRA